MTSTPEESVASDDKLKTFREFVETGDRRVRNQLVEEYRWVAHHCARRFSDRGEPHDDLVQVAQLGLVKAVERFNPDHGSSFPSFAIPTVLGELRRHFRDTTWAVHVPRAAKDLAVSLPKEMEALRHQLGRAPTVDELASRLGIGAAAVVEALDASNAYRPASLSAPAFDDGSPLQWGGEDIELSRAEARLAAGRLIATLPEREQKIIKLRFFDEMSQSEIAAEIGISQMHVSRLLRAALTALREEMDRFDTDQQNGT